MDSDPLPAIMSIALVLFLVALNGFFVAAELALSKVKSGRIESLAEEGGSNARFARRIVNQLDRYLSATQLGTTLTSLALGFAGGPAIAALLKPILSPLQMSETIVLTISFIAAFSLIAILHVIFGGKLPKALATHKAEQVMLASAAPILIFKNILYPFIWISDGVSNGILKAFGIDRPSEYESAHTEDEIRGLMQESHKNGLIDNTELTLVHNIFEFVETTAKEIMIPRTEMDCLYANLSFAENLTIAMKDMRTRYPVCDPDKDNIIGFVHIKDFLKADANLKGIRKLVRPITTVPDSIQISDLLKLMQKKKSQMALLIDEYGGTSGLVTLEDIMEEIVGEIQDEFDEERPRIEIKDEFTYSIDGLMLIEEVNDYFGTNIDSDDYDTIGGWIYSRIQIPPTKNQQFVYNDEFIFTVEEMDHLRIARIMLRRIPELQQNIS